MTNLRAQQLSFVYRDISFLSYEHPEGGAYAFVRFLSLLRHVPAIVSDERDLRYIEELQHRLNLALEARLSRREEVFFKESQKRVLKLLRGYLTIVEPLSAGMVAL